MTQNLVHVPMAADVPGRPHVPHLFVIGNPSAVDQVLVRTPGNLAAASGQVPVVPPKPQRVTTTSHPSGSVRPSEVVARAQPAEMRAPPVMGANALQHMLTTLMGQMQSGLQH